MTFPFAQSVTWVSRAQTGSRDAMGVDIRTAVNVTISVPFWQESTTQEVQGQLMVKEVAYVIVPSGSVVGAADQFIVNGITYRVNGSPWALVSPLTGTDVGIQIKLEQVSG